MSKAEGTRVVAPDEGQTGGLKKQQRVQVCRVRAVEESDGRGGKGSRGSYRPVGTFPCPGPSDRLRVTCLTPVILVSFNCGSSAGRNARTELLFLMGRGKGAGVRMKSAQREAGPGDGRWIPEDTAEPLSLAMPEANLYP